MYFIVMHICTYDIVLTVLFNDAVIDITEPLTLFLIMFFPLFFVLFILKEQTLRERYFEGKTPHPVTPFVLARAGIKLIQIISEVLAVIFIITIIIV
jgi:hypothetical protein